MHAAGAGRTPPAALARPLLVASDDDGYLRLADRCVLPATPVAEPKPGLAGPDRTEPEGLDRGSPDYAGRRGKELVGYQLQKIRKPVQVEFPPVTARRGAFKVHVKDLSGLCAHDLRFCCDHYFQNSVPEMPQNG